MAKVLVVLLLLPFSSFSKELGSSSMDRLLGDSLRVIRDRKPLKGMKAEFKRLKDRKAQMEKYLGTIQSVFYSGRGSISEDKWNELMTRETMLKNHIKHDEKKLGEISPQYWILVEKERVHAQEKEAQRVAEAEAERRTPANRLGESDKSVRGRIQETASKMASFAKDVLLGREARAEDAPMCKDSYINSGINHVKANAISICQILKEVDIKEGYTDDVLKQISAVDLIPIRWQVKIILKGLYRISEYLSTNPIDKTLLEEVAISIHHLRKTNERIKEANEKTLSTNPLSKAITASNLFHFVGYALGEYEFSSANNTFQRNASNGNNFLIWYFTNIAPSDAFDNYLNLTQYRNTTLHERAMPLLAQALSCLGENVDMYNKEGRLSHKTPLAISLDTFVKLNSSHLELINTNSFGKEGYLRLSEFVNYYMISLMKVVLGNSSLRYTLSDKNDQDLIDKKAKLFLTPIIERSRATSFDKLGKQTGVLNACFGNKPIPQP